MRNRTERKKTFKYLNRLIESSILLVLFLAPISKSAIEIFSTVSILLYLAKKILLEKDYKLGMDGKLLILSGVFLLLNALSIVNSEYIWLSLKAVVSKALKWILFLIAVSGTMKTDKQFRRILAVILISCLVILADAYWQKYVTGKDFLHYPNNYPVFKFEDRQFGAETFPTGSFPYPNDFATWINVMMFTVLGCSLFDLKDRKWIRGAALIICALLLFFLFLTSTRGALIGSAIAAAVLVATNIRKILLPVCAGIIGILLLISLVPAARTHVTKNVFDLKLSIEDRSNMWKTGWSIFMRHPVIGNGINTFFEHYKNERDDEYKHVSGSYAHNCYLQMAADIGALGLISFIALVMFVIIKNTADALKNLSELKNALRFGLALGLIAFLAHAFVDTNLYSLNLSAVFWLGMGIVNGGDEKKV